MAERELTPKEALSYLDDIAHGRKMSVEPHALYCIVKKALDKIEVLDIIFEAPSIIEQLFKLGQLGKEAEDRYYWGTITDSKVAKVKEFFADDKTKMFSKGQ